MPRFKVDDVCAKTGLPRWIVVKQLDRYGERVLLPRRYRGAHRIVPADRLPLLLSLLRQDGFLPPENNPAA